MRSLVGLVVLVLMVACSEEKPPVPVEPPRPSLPPNKVIPVLPPAPSPAAEPPTAVAAFPEDHLTQDVGTDGRLMELLLSDPREAERQLATLATPNAWRVALLAQFALAHGKNERPTAREPELPSVAADAGMAAVGKAWVAADAVALMSLGKKPAVLQQLPVATRVEITSIDGGTALISVAIAQLVFYGDTGSAPERMVTQQLEGTVPLDALSPATIDANELIALATAQPADEKGQLKAIALWERAWRVERSARTREGLLRAGWAAERASTVVRAAMAHDFAAVSELRFAWTCTDDAPPTSKWVDLSKGPPKKLPPKVCLSAVDDRKVCKDMSAKEKKKSETLHAWLEKEKLSPKSWLHFTVDARERKQVFFVTTPLQVVDACDDFEQVSVEAGSGLVRRLALPLGIKRLDVWVPAALHTAVDFSIPAATAEAEAIEWLRSRERYKWTVGVHGDLQPSLGTDSMGFDVPADVTASSYALPPERSCECQHPE